MPQTEESQYGREPITVSDQCPTVIIRYRLDRTHVGTHPDEVADMIREAVAARREAGDTEWTPELEAEAVAYALWRHAENRASYAWVMGSH